MALTKAQLEAGQDALQTALMSGELIVRFADRTIQYRSVAEIQAALADTKTAIEELDGTRNRVYRVGSVKGFAQ